MKNLHKGKQSLGVSSKTDRSLTKTQANVKAKCHGCGGIFPVTELRALRSGFASIIDYGEKKSYCYDCSFLYRNPAHWVRIAWNRATIKRKHILLASFLVLLFSPIMLILYLAYGTLLLTLYLAFLIPIIPLRTIWDVLGKSRKGTKIKRKRLTLFLNPGILGNSLRENHDLWWQGKLGVKDWGYRRDTILKNIFSLTASIFLLGEITYYGLTKTYIIDPFPTPLNVLIILYLAAVVYYWIRAGIAEKLFPVIGELLLLGKVFYFDLREIGIHSFSYKERPSHNNPIYCAQCGEKVKEGEDRAKCEQCGFIFHSKELFSFIWDNGYCPNCRNVSFPKRINVDDLHD